MLFSKRSSVILVGLALLFVTGVAAMALETQLAGIRLGAPGSDVLKRYGNPSRITVGYVNMGGAQGNQLGQPGMPGAPAGGPPSAAPTSPLSQLGAYYNNLNTMTNEAGGGAPVLPGVPGLGMPGASSMPGIAGPGRPGAQGPAADQEQQIIWTYDRPGGTTLEFIVSDKGVVVQITAGGDGNFALAKTTKGVKFGTSYKDVLMKYGFPESHINMVANGKKFVRTSYADKDRVVFTFLNEKVVGITVALKLDD